MLWKALPFVVLAEADMLAGQIKLDWSMLFIKKLYKQMAFIFTSIIVNVMARVIQLHTRTMHCQSHTFKFINGMSCSAKVACG